ncbi:bis(5'-nucleosyl)-tetraphosphatase [Thermocoleostomius sinensis]|uniref:Bis(5'-nucleosyl)-tetraphosphatase [asymmetrical] n=1 Tax=Thermocoleostomius sinensis A174 TaxID=2016057 RepID=A0A9E9C3X1_9CYAN|nr:NUDIX domain-containing protein [Thermocoleostomius sinensis]WAL59386.1 NUDIX domain-containing protein [Thermocoleostomius sinensis A174]
MTDHARVHTNSVFNDEAFGIVPIDRRSNGDHFLLIQHHAGHWGFPKGHAEAEESPQVAACREFEEETGIQDYTLLPVSFTEKYCFIESGRTIEKTVVYFPAFVRSNAVICQAKEIRDFAWLTYEAALEKLTFAQARQLLTAVRHYLVEQEDLKDLID